MSTAALSDLVPDTVDAATVIVSPAPRDRVSPDGLVRGTEVVLEPLMTARQVAAYLQTTPRRVVDLWKSDQLKGFWLNPSGRRDLRFRPSDVESFLEARSRPIPRLAG